jgi:hypothetical protein
LGQKIDGIFTAFGINAVVGPFSNFTAFDDAGFAEYFHVVREGGLGHSGAFNQLAGALLAILQKLQNSLPPFIAEGLKDNGSLFVDGFYRDHLKSRFLDLSINIKSKKVNMKKAGALQHLPGKMNL